MSPDLKINQEKGHKITQLDNFRYRTRYFTARLYNTVKKSPSQIRVGNKNMKKGNDSMTHSAAKPQPKRGAPKSLGFLFQLVPRDYLFRKTHEPIHGAQLKHPCFKCFLNRQSLSAENI